MLNKLLLRAMRSAIRAKDFKAVVEIGKLLKDTEQGDLEQRLKELEARVSSIIAFNREVE